MSRYYCKVINISYL